MVHGIQKDIELDITPYTLFTLKSHTVGLSSASLACFGVVYQFANIGINDNKAGEIHVFSIITATTFFVMVMGYFNGFTMA